MAAVVGMVLVGWEGCAMAGSTSYSATLGAVVVTEGQSGSQFGSCGVGQVAGGLYPTVGFGWSNGAQYAQWAAGPLAPGPLVLPAAATLVGAVASGTVAETAVGGVVSPPTPGSIEVVDGLDDAHPQAEPSYCSGFAYAVDRTFLSWPGDGRTIAYRMDAYQLASGLLQYGSDGNWGEYLAMGGGAAWFAPLSPVKLTVEYAFTPAGITAGPVWTGQGVQANVAWNSDGNPAGTTYVVQRQTVGGGGPVGPWATIYSGTATGFSTQDQQCGKAYRYRVAASGMDAQTPWDVTRQWAAHPCGLSVMAVGTTALTVSFAPVGQAAHYELYWCASAACRQVQLPLNTATAVRLGGLTPNTAYTVWACTTTDPAGCPAAAAWTQAAIPVDLAQTPAAPAFLQAGLQWSANGNPSGTVYEVRSQSVGAPTTAVVACRTTGRTCATNGLGLGAHVQLNVRAWNGAGIPSAWSGPLVFANALVPVVTAIGATRLNVRWPTGPVGVHYAVMRQRQGTSATSLVAVGSASPTTLDGLRPATAYRVWLLAWAPEGPGVAGGWCGGGGCWPVPAAGGDVGTWAATPVAGSVLAGQTTLTAHWDTGGNPAGTAYAVVVDTPGRRRLASGLTSATSYTFTGLAPGTPAQVWVQAVGFDAQPTPAGQTPQPPDSRWMAEPASVTVPMSPIVTGAVSGLGWHPVAGRAEVHLHWLPSIGATGYTVWVWDGAVYERFAVGDVTAWDSDEARIYPPQARLYPRAAAGSLAPPAYVAPGTGWELRDRPFGLYCALLAALCPAGGDPGYRFAVTASNASGDSASYQAPGTVATSAYVVTPPLQTDPGTPVIRSFTLQGGSISTYASAVSFTLSAAESTSGVAAYALSNDGVVWVPTALAGCEVGQSASCAHSLVTQGRWQLTPGPGSKTVFTRVESVAGVWSAPVPATIYVAPDQTAPTVDVVLDGGAPVTAETSVSVAVRVSDPAAAAAGQAFQARYSTDGGQSWSAWRSEGTSRAWSQAWTIPGGPGGQRQLLVQVEDAAGNLGQGGAMIGYVPVAATVVVPGSSGHACSWSVGGRTVTATCVTRSQVAVPLHPSPGQVQLRVSLNNVTWGPWRSVTTSLPLDLGPGAGGRTVWVAYRNAQGTVQTVSPVWYVVDPAPPRVRARWLGGAGASGPSGQATILLQGTDDAGGAAALRVRVSENGTVLYTGPFSDSVPVHMLGSGYQFVQVAVADPAGNRTTVQLGIYVQ